jgi:hypothetical protein
MPKSSLPFDADEYAPVAERITLFYAKYPAGRLITELVHRDEHTVVFKALAFRDVADAAPAATGWAEERIGDGEVNEVACLENTETSALGRALANLGFTASSRRPSAEEMQKAARMRTRLNAARADAPFASRSAPRVYERMAAAEYRPDALRLDTMWLLAEAERLGFDRSRAARLRAGLARPGASPGAIQRLERSLRQWLARRDRSA